MQKSDRLLQSSSFEKGQIQASKQGHLAPLELLGKLNTQIYWDDSFLPRNVCFLFYLIFSKEMNSLSHWFQISYVLKMPHKSADGHQVVVISEYVVELKLAAQANELCFYPSWPHR